MFMGGMYVLFIIILLLVAKSVSLIPFSFDVSCRPQFPMTGLKTSLPIFALKLPTIIFVSCAEIL